MTSEECIRDALRWQAMRYYVLHGMPVDGLPPLMRWWFGEEFPSIKHPTEAELDQCLDALGNAWRKGHIA